MTITDGNSSIRFGRVDGYQAPGWPDASAPKRHHFDLPVDDLGAAVGALPGLGAGKPEFHA